MDNNLSEGQLRKVVRIRDAALFAGSDEHAGHILSLIASARLHELDPERYLRDVIRILPHWPRQRFLELAPLHWRATRDRLDPQELDAELRPLHVPDPPQKYRSVWFPKSVCSTEQNGVTISLGAQPQSVASRTERDETRGIGWS
ncbi:MAG TPA: transposase domain-containing protein [Polyangiaceae bacterium]|nr:transposase domain-containing protein [Polyangiaceae bacterium]